MPDEEEAMNHPLLGVVLVVACSRSPHTEPKPTKIADSWISGSIDQRFALVEKHLRGFDVAMVETGYRYGELFWAGEDRNWEYATYQLEKIETTIANGIERRPKRAASAAMLAPAIARVRAAVGQQDPGAFAESFAFLTQTCNACHVAEKMAFIQIALPSERQSSVRAVAATGDARVTP
jgi:hypothetical protein